MLVRILGSSESRNESQGESRANGMITMCTVEYLIFIVKRLNLLGPKVNFTEVECYVFIFKEKKACPNQFSSLS